MLQWKDDGVKKLLAERDLKIEVVKGFPKNSEPANGTRAALVDVFVDRGIANGGRARSKGSSGNTQEQTAFPNVGISRRPPKYRPRHRTRRLARHESRGVNRTHRHRPSS
jgi:hypothetical protein